MLIVRPGEGAVLGDEGCAVAWGDKRGALALGGPRGFVLDSSGALALGDKRAALALGGELKGLAVGVARSALASGNVPARQRIRSCSRRAKARRMWVSSGMAGAVGRRARVAIRVRAALRPERKRPRRVVRTVMGS